MKKKLMLFSLLVAAAMIAWLPHQSKAQLLVPIGNANVDATWLYPFTQYYYSPHWRTAAIYSEQAILNSGGGPGLISRLEWLPGQVTWSTDYKNDFSNHGQEVKIYLGTTSLTNFPDANHTFAGMKSGAAPVNVQNVTEVYSGPMFANALPPNQWAGVDLTTPFVYVGGNVVVIIQYDEPNNRSYPGYPTYLNEYGVWKATYIYGNPPGPDNTVRTFVYSPGYQYGDANYWDTWNLRYYYSNYRPDIRLSVLQGIEASFPEDKDPRRILRAGDVYDGSNGTHPHPSITFRQSSGTQINFTYVITGPAPSTDTIYVGRNAANTSDIITLNPTSSGLVTFNIPRARGGAAGTNGALNLTNANGGSYRLSVHFTSNTGIEQYWTKEFLVAFNNDISIKQIVFPYQYDKAPFFKYPKGVPIPVGAKFQNVGLNTIKSFEVQAQIFTEGGTLLYTDIDTVSGVSLQTGDELNYDFATFMQTDNVGIYKTTVCSKLLTVIVNGQEVSVADQQLGNDCIPKVGETYAFQIQHEIEIETVAITSPDNSFSVCAGRPFSPLGVVKNNGIADLSDVPVRLNIYKLPGRTLVKSMNTTVPDVSFNQQAEVRFSDVLLLTDAGNYEAELVATYNASVDPVQSNNKISTFFSVQPALAGQYEVGVGGQFPTIESAIDALYSCGVGGPVTFLLTDAEYSIGSLGANLPAIDLTAAILGVSATNTVTWRPADNRIGTRGGVTITMKSGAGVGIQLGQNLFPSNRNAAIAEFPTVHNYANASGYMIFDGGEYKALRLRLQTNATHGHRAVVYIGRGAANYSVMNCLIDNAPGSQVSYAASLPKQNISTTSFTYEDDIRADGRTYSAGVVIRNTVPVNRVGNNSERLDTLNNSNNKIVGNEISGFGYGVVSLGAGVLFQANASKLVGYYNEGTEISKNKIWNVGRAGIYAGFERNSKIVGNRIYNVGTAVGATGDAAGIIAGGEQRYNNEKLLISGNEISGVSSSVSSSGIRVEQVLNQIVHPSGQVVNFPSGNVQMRTQNNAVWGLSRSATAGRVVGIHYTTARDANATGINALLQPAVATYFTDGDEIVNNTVVMSNDNIAGTNAVVGIGIQQSKGAKLYNNAIAMLGSATASNFIHAGIVYQGVKAGTSVWGLQSDNNAYWLGNAEMARVVETTNKSELLSLGMQNEFKNVEQWRALTKQDDNSVVGNFMADMEYLGVAPAQQLRVKSNPAPLGSLLDNRGRRVGGVTMDIDGDLRGEAEMPYDIGADEFMGRQYVADMEAVRIISPRTYKRESGMFSEAEYVMNKGAASIVTRIRNNGSLPQSGVTVTARYYRETNASAGNPSMPAVYSLIGSMQKQVSIASGKYEDVEFDFSSNFNPQTYNELGYNVPGQFATMSRNVTPRYKLEVEMAADINRGNDQTSKEVRFYAYRSKTGIMVSEIGGGVGTPVTANEIAGKLNADTLQAGLKALGNWTYNAGDFDVLERSGWEPYGVNYSLYRTLMWSHDNTMLSRQQREDIRSFLSAGTDLERRNLVMGSQEVARLHVGTDLLTDQAFVNQVLRAEYVKPGTPLTPDYNEHEIEGMAVANKIREVLRNTGYTGDVNPLPALVRVYSDATTQGTAEEAYRYMETDAGLTVDAMGVATSVAPKYNVVYYGVDWRHVGRMSGSEAARSGVQRLLKGALDYFSENGGWMVPVELSNFDARKSGTNAVSVEWTTASEQNSSYFEVERREKDGGTFAVVGSRVMAQGNSTVRTDYRSVDETVLGGRVYVYRLRSVDADGSYGYSQEVEVDMGRASGDLVVGEVRPNPVGLGEATVGYELAEGQHVTVSLYSSDGRYISELWNGYRTSGNHSVSVSTRELSSGQYVVVIKTSAGDISRKLQVVK